VPRLRHVLWCVAHDLPRRLHRRQENPIYLAKSERERIARGETVTKSAKKGGKK
jgi:hypothetical protein